MMHNFSKSVLVLIIKRFICRFLSFLILKMLFFLRLDNDNIYGKLIKNGLFYDVKQNMYFNIVCFQHFISGLV